VTGRIACQLMALFVPKPVPDPNDGLDGRERVRTRTCISGN
jgi:hypothetical protein